MAKIMQSKNHVNYRSAIFVGQERMKKSSEICLLVAVLLVVLVIVVKRRELRCTGFLQTPKEGIFGFEH